MKYLKYYETYKLENPDLADLDKDGEISEYEYKRGKAIEDSIKEKEREEEDRDCDCDCEDCEC